MLVLVLDRRNVVGVLPMSDHEKLDAYRLAIDVVSTITKLIQRLLEQPSTSTSTSTSTTRALE